MNISLNLQNLDPKIVLHDISLKDGSMILQYVLITKIDDCEMTRSPTVFGDLIIGA